MVWVETALVQVAQDLQWAGWIIWAEWEWAEWEVAPWIFPMQEEVEAAFTTAQTVEEGTGSIPTVVESFPSSNPVRWSCKPKTYRMSARWMSFDDVNAG
mmetsp:Transcript_15963/g.53449  ORF Transcript_15963/g.53449 Transcript_15963/m.53449 type:complete len:99 (+) Transcript_15963:1147-1443(+)